MLLWIYLLWSQVSPYAVMPSTKPVVGIVSRYGDPGDRLGSGTMFCTKKRPDREVMGCAHRTLPCGTRLLIENPRTRKRAFCFVLDRGPYGAVHEGKWLVKVRPSDPGKWRGILDITPAVSKALGHNGFETMRVWVVSKPPPRPKGRVRPVLPIS